MKDWLSRKRDPWQSLVLLCFPFALILAMNFYRFLGWRSFWKLKRWQFYHQVTRFLGWRSFWKLKRWQFIHQVTALVSGVRAGECWTIVVCTFAITTYAEKYLNVFRTVNYYNSPNCTDNCELPCTTNNLLNYIYKGCCHPNDLSSYSNTFTVKKKSLIYWK